MRIYCDVNACSHHANGECYANFVEVQGKNAAKDGETFCSSFIGKEVYSSLTDNVVSGGCCDSLACEVRTCAYNDRNGRCELDSIQVDGCTASSYQETNCASFVKR